MLFLFGVLAPAPAHADSVRIINGMFEWNRSTGDYSISLKGTRGFTFEGAPHLGIFNPLDQCALPECSAGTNLSLHTSWIGNDLTGTATYRGVTYSPVGSMADDSAQMRVTWHGNLLIPSSFTGGTLTAPFTFTGAFAYPSGDPPFWPLTVVDLFGHGTATLTFSPWPGSDFPGALILDSVIYEFDAAAATPEPASILLLGTGLVGVAAARRRRTAARS